MNADSDKNGDAWERAIAKDKQSRIDYVRRYIGAALQPAERELVLIEFDKIASDYNPAGVVRL